MFVEAHTRSQSYSEDPYPTPGLRDATLIGRNCYSFTTESGKCHPWGHLVLFLCFSYVFPPKRWLWLRVTTPLGKNKLFLTQSMLRNRNSCTNILISYTFLGNAFQEKLALSESDNYRDDTKSSLINPFNNKSQKSCALHHEVQQP